MSAAPSSTGAQGLHPEALPERRALRKEVTGYRYVPLSLLIAAVCLATGQILLGVTIESMNREPEHYSVMGGVIDLWTRNEHLLATILFFFSIIFPTGKLLALAWIWFRPMERKRRARWSLWLELSGKWSMLDAFVVTALVGSVQLRKLVTAATARPEPAVYYFAVAILLSMWLSLLISRLAARTCDRPRGLPKLDLSVLLAAWSALACTIGALLQPIFSVEKGVFSNVYALPRATRELFKDGEWFLGSLVSLFVALVPMLFFGGLGFAVLMRRLGRNVDRALYGLVALERWAMVDVYLLAVLLVYTRVGHIATVERLPGFWWVAAATGLSIYCSIRISKSN